jgi:hypothetical protein
VQPQSNSAGGLEQSDMIKGEAEHAPSPLLQEHVSATTIEVCWRFGAKRHD